MAVPRPTASCSCVFMAWRCWRARLQGGWGACSGPAAARARQARFGMQPRPYRGPRPPRTGLMGRPPWASRLDSSGSFGGAAKLSLPAGQQGGPTPAAGRCHRRPGCRRRGRQDEARGWTRRAPLPAARSRCRCKGCSGRARARGLDPGERHRPQAGLWRNDPALQGRRAAAVQPRGKEPRTWFWRAGSETWAYSPRMERQIAELDGKGPLLPP